VTLLLPYWGLVSVRAPAESSSQPRLVQPELGVAAALDGDDEEISKMVFDAVDCVDWLFELGRTKLFMLNPFEPPLRGWLVGGSMIGTGLSYQISDELPLQVCLANLYCEIGRLRKELLKTLS
jgi:hypothetical protein